MTRSWTVLDIRRLTAMRHAGVSLRDCARHFGRTIPAITNQCVKYRIIRYPKLQPPSNLSHRIADCSAAHLTFAHTASNLGVSTWTLRCWLRSRGILWRRSDSDRCRERIGMASQDKHRASAALLGWPQAGGRAQAVALAGLARIGGWVSPRDLLVHIDPPRHPTTLSRSLRGLDRLCLVERVGNGKARRYRLAAHLRDKDSA